jgi:hypothetical protein
MRNYFILDILSLIPFNYFHNKIIKIFSIFRLLKLRKVIKNILENIDLND